MCSKGMLLPSIVKSKEKSLLSLPSIDPMRRLLSNAFGFQPVPYMPNGIRRSGSLWQSRSTIDESCAASAEKEG